MFSGQKELSKFKGWVRYEVWRLWGVQEAEDLGASTMKGGREGGSEGEKAVRKEGKKEARKEERKLAFF